MYFSMKNLIFILMSFSCTGLLAQEFPIATGSYSQTYPSAVFANDIYFNTFLDKSGGSYNYGFHGKLIETDGNVLPQDIQIIPPISYLSFMHEIIRGQDEYLFVWSRGVSIYDRDAYGQRVGDDGYSTGSLIPLSIGNVESASFVEAAFDGENYLAIWQEGLPDNGAVIRAQFLNQQGQLIGNNFSVRPDGLGSNVAQIYPDVEFNGEHYLVVWDDNRNGNRDVYGQFVSVTGELIGGDFAISTHVTDQMLVQLAFGGQNFYAVWADERLSSNDNSIYGQLISADGALIGENLVISPQTNSEGRSWPDVAASNGEYLVVWDQEWLEYKEGYDSREFTRGIKYQFAGVEMPRPTVWYDIYARKISFQGEYASDEMAICTAEYHQQDCDVISDGADFLVSWSDSRNNNMYYDIYGYIVEGSELPIPPVLTPQEMDFVNMEQIENGQDFSVMNPNSFPVNIDTVYFATSGDRIWYLTDPVNFPLTIHADSLVSMTLTMMLPAGNALAKSFETDTMIVEAMDTELELLLNIHDALLDSIQTPKMTLSRDSLYFQTVNQAIEGLSFDMSNLHYAGLAISGFEITGAYGLWEVIPDEELPYAIGFMDTLNFHVLSNLPVVPDFEPDEMGIDTLWFDSWGFQWEPFLIYYETAVIDSLWTHVPQIPKAGQMQIHPNPATDIVFLQLPGGQTVLKVEILDVDGKIVKSMDAANSIRAYPVELSGLKSGLYLLRVISPGKTYTHKLVIQ